ncbi:hypothetical protein L2E82_40135 [Cichorium intybus]|uniref:Uncharacterized protein n=1 Tax=Cichorium intybus TaxID=13427 RepID=A0ACB9AJM1_CICIN|nr:hypothetical protein L2E82_40135 [Cichorium intybus]
MSPLNSPWVTPGSKSGSSCKRMTRKIIKNNISTKVSLTEFHMFNGFVKLLSFLNSYQNGTRIRCMMASSSLMIPQGAAVHNFVIQLVLSKVATETIKIYNAISDGSVNLVDKFFEMQRHDALKTLDIYRRAGQQILELRHYAPEFPIIIMCFVHNLQRQLETNVQSVDVGPVTVGGRMEMQPHMHIDSFVEIGMAE